MSFLLLIFNLFIHLLVVNGDFFWNDRVLELSDQENFKRFPRRDRLHSATVAGNANSINWHRTQTRIFADAVIRGPRVVPHCFRMFGEKVDLKTLLICVCLFILATGKLAMVETVHPLGDCCRDCCLTTSKNVTVVKEVFSLEYPKADAVVAHVLKRAAVRPIQLGAKNKCRIVFETSVQINIPDITVYAIFIGWSTFANLTLSLQR